MADTGKLMRGTTGLFVRSTAGELVRASILFPYSPWFNSDAAGIREVTYADDSTLALCAQSDIWSASWASPPPGVMQTIFQVYDREDPDLRTTYSKHQCRVASIGTAIIDPVIPWDRVKTFELKFRLRCTGLVSGYAVKFVKLDGATGLPDGTDIQTWDVVASVTSDTEWTDYVITWPMVDGEPTSLGYGVYIDGSSCPTFPSDYIYSEGVLEYMGHTLEYNLDP